MKDVRPRGISWCDYRRTHNSHNTTQHNTIEPPWYGIRRFANRLVYYSYLYQISTAKWPSIPFCVKKCPIGLYNYTANRHGPGPKAWIQRDVRSSVEDLPHASHLSVCISVPPSITRLHTANVAREMSEVNNTTAPCPHCLIHSRDWNYSMKPIAWRYRIKLTLTLFPSGHVI